MIERPHWIPFLFVAGAMAAFGCGSGGSGYTPTPVKPAASESFKPGDELAMFPSKVGNQWTYMIEQTSAAKGKNTVSLKGELTLKVVAVNPIANGNVMELDVLQPAKDPQAA